MGIHDRDYYREDEGGFLGGWARTGQVTKSVSGGGHISIG